MEFVREFFQVYAMYFQDLWLTLAIGFLISGFFYKFIPTDFIEKHLGEKGLRPILISSFVGTLLPICCIGSFHRYNPSAQGGNAGGGPGFYGGDSGHIGFSVNCLLETAGLNFYRIYILRDYFHGACNGRGGKQYETKNCGRRK